MRFLIAFCSLIVLIASTAHAGTINLPPGPYCATTQTGAIYDGVTAGACAVTPPGDVAPPGRQLTATIKYPNAPGSGIRNAVNVTQWGTVFGHRNSTDPESAWPGAAGASPAIAGFTGNGYIALEFTPTVRAQVTVGVSSYYGWLLDGAWSTRPGDFTGSAACAGARGGGDSFQKMSSDPARPGCYIPKGQRAYFNIRLHKPQDAPVTAQFNLSTLVFGP